MCLELESVAKKRFLEIFLDIFKSIDIFNFTDVIMCLNLSVWHLLELPMIMDAEGILDFPDLMK